MSQLSITCATGSAAMCLVVSVLACGCRGQTAAMHDSVLVEGTILVTGNEPFTRLTLQSDDGAQRTIQDDGSGLYSELWKLQGQRIRAAFRPAADESDSLHIFIERYELVKNH